MNRALKKSQASEALVCKDDLGFSVEQGLVQILRGIQKPPTPIHTNANKTDGNNNKSTQTAFEQKQKLMLKSWASVVWRWSDLEKSSQEKTNPDLNAACAKSLIVVAQMHPAFLWMGSSEKRAVCAPDSLSDGTKWETLKQYQAIDSGIPKGYEKELNAIKNAMCA